MRIKKLDEIRGIAVVLMIIYHFLFDLNYFGIYSINLDSLPLTIFQRIIGITFVAVSGFSLAISDKSKNEKIKRSIFLGGIALAITIATWIYPNESFIKFGIIHFIALSSFILLFFADLGIINLFLGIFAIILGLYFSNLTVQTPYLFWLGLTDASYSTLDHYPFFPWIGVAFIGFYLGIKLTADIHQNSIDNNRKQAKSQSCNLKPTILEKIGRNSLLIYLVHQPILIIILFLLSYLAIFH